MAEEKEIQDMIAIWAIRALLRSKEYSRALGRYVIKEEEETLRTVGLAHLEGREFKGKEFRKELTDQLKRLEGTPPTRKSRFFRNIQHLAESLGLSDSDRELLVFALLLQEDLGLEGPLEAIGDLTVRQSRLALAAILKIRPSSVEKSLRQAGALQTSGLLRISKTHYASIPERLKPLEGLCSAIREGSLDQGLSVYFYRSPKPRLAASDFPHLQKDLSVLRPFLKNALSGKVQGVNVLLYGPPGTGKTELARTLARDLSVSLFEVSSEDEDGDPTDKDSRFRSYLLCQKLLSRRDASLILFDEVEDVFPVSDFEFSFSIRRSGRHKGWTNRLLESNPVPAIWIANSIDQIDPAFIRRFDMAMEVPVPPRSIRQRVFQRIVKDLPVGSEWLQRISENEHLAPSHMEKAVKVVALAEAETSKDAERILDHVLSGIHKAMGLSRSKPYRSHLFRGYSTEFINSDFDLASLIDSLKEQGTGKICLYGPPGSGKTAFVHHVGEQLQKPVRLKRASDLLSCYVGETEKGMATMFEEATREGAILLLDEADSFLQSRSRANRSWEVTQVNELLVQMESFDGIFFCATNLFEILDSAVFRRFDLKVKFDYLKSNQILDLFRSLVAQFETSLSPVDCATWKPLLNQLGEVTPGDFAAAQRKLSLLKMPLDPKNLYESLVQESAVKPRQSKPLGF